MRRLFVADFDSDDGVSTTKEDQMMKKHDTIKSVWIMTILAISTSAFAAGGPAPVSLTPEGKKLEAHYSKMLADLTEEIKRLEPKVDKKKKAEFTRA
jgi:hypothetical protein